MAVVRMCSARMIVRKKVEEEEGEAQNRDRNRGNVKEEETWPGWWPVRFLGEERRVAKQVRSCLSGHIPLRAGWAGLDFAKTILF